MQMAPPIDTAPHAGRPRRNLIVLTCGLSGSSVYTALLSQAGYWCGDRTMVKPDYDTHENAQLVELNEELLRQLAPGLQYQHEFDHRAVLEIARRAGEHHLAPLREFVSSCGRHGPWLWKDPRLTWTIRVWARVLDRDSVDFLVITRDTVQAWITANLRRHVQSLAYTRHYNDGILHANLEFIDRGPVLLVSFEDLLLRPPETLARLNQHLGLHLTLEQLKAVCKLPLYRRSRGWRDGIEAGLIYLKNYPTGACCPARARLTRCPRERRCPSLPLSLRPRLAGRRRPTATTG
jgi:hypothetical protein